MIWRGSRQECLGAMIWRGWRGWRQTQGILSLPDGKEEGQRRPLRLWAVSVLSSSLSSGAIIGKTRANKERSGLVWSGGVGLVLCTSMRAKQQYPSLSPFLLRQQQRLSSLFARPSQVVAALLAGLAGGKGGKLGREDFPRFWAGGSGWRLWGWP